MTNSQPTWSGRTLGGRYVIQSLLGRGGMSSVYKATDPNLQRTVAIKIIHPHLSENPEFVKRFEQEAAAVAKLRHPNILQVHDFNHEGKVYYIVFEYVAGDSLDKRLAALKEAGLRLPLDETIRILVPLCDAVAYAHERNMIHRDLKPSNVIINLLGQPMLLDFGIAKMVGGGQVHTATGATIGTAAYMSPEQVIGEEIDHRADIYSLGVMLYEMAGGRPPFQGSSALTVMMKHVNEPIPDIRLFNSNIPDVFMATLEKALAKRPEERFSSALAMGNALREIAQQMTSYSTHPFFGTQQAAPIKPQPGRPSAMETAREREVGQPSPAKPQQASSSLPQVPAEPVDQAESPPARSHTKTAPDSPPYQPTSAVPIAAVPAAEEASMEPAGQRTRRALPLAWIAGAAIIVLAIAAGAFLLLPRLAGELPTSAGMVRIPGGTYTVGHSGDAGQYVPRQQVTLREFWIDRFEVTNAQYAEYLEAAGAEPPAGWNSSTPPGGKESHPVQGITWDMANAYCDWANKRLPTEAEWEVAARGPQNLLYPWGDEINAVSLPTDTYATGAVPANRSAFGVFDMAGNVWEWVDEPYAPIANGQRVARGGAYDFLKDMAYRLQGNPDVPTMYSTSGVRCAADEVEVVDSEEILVSDDFTDPQSGWPEVSEASALSGYHPPDYYHVQSGEANHITTAYFGANFDNISMESEVFVDSTDSEGGIFRYGLVVRRSGDNFYAFTVSPRQGTWAVLKASAAGLQVLQEGSNNTIAGLSAESADTLRVDASGPNLAFAINGRVVATLRDGDYATGDIGFYVETFDETRAHIHYDSLTVQQLPSAPVTNVLFSDDFTDPESGWPAENDGATLFGYHPPNFYHVQSGAPNHRSLAFFDRDLDNFTMEAEIFVDSTDTDTGDFYYGVGLRRQGEAYYAFLISPRTQAWQVIKNSDSGSEILAQGSDDSILEPAETNRLRVDADGSNLIFQINGRAVAQVEDGDYASGDIGFVVETIDETRAHIHYSNLLVREVEANLEAAPTAVAEAGEATETTESDAEPTEPPTVEAAPAPTLAPTPEGPLPSSVGMVKVDAGTYTVGENTVVEVAEFWIDRYEVTNAEYAEFIEETGQEPPETWAEANIPAEMGDHPVQGITWDTAVAYCQWADKRLATEAEWEVAARGPHGWLYPWGNDRAAVPLPGSGTYPVGSIPANRSYFGAFDMAGNVWEWVNEPYDPVGEGEQVLHGGANNFQNDMRFRAAGDPNSAIMFVNAGIRCASSQVQVESEPAAVLSDDFADINSGWFQARAPVDAYFYGYHPTDFYHVQVSAPNDCLSVRHEVPLDSYMVEAEIFTVATETQTGDFYNGLALRETGNEFYAFVVSPRSQRWQVLKNTPDGLAVVAEGNSATIRGDAQATRDRLFVIANGPEFTFFVNGELVSRVTDADYSSGNVGFVVKTVDETYAHVHYDAIRVWPLPAGVEPATAEAAGAEYPIAAPFCRGTISDDDRLVSFTTHTVITGETLSSISVRYGITVEEILAANGRTIENPGFIRAGQTIIIPQA